MNSCQYYPEGNSIIERLFRTSKDMIYATSNENGRDWVQSIPLVNIGLRCSWSRPINQIPHEIIFGRKLRLPWTQLEEQTVSQDIHQYIDQLDRNIKHIQSKVKERNHCCPKEFQKFKRGEKVMVKIKGSGINSKKYFGPCTVVNYIGRNNYELKYNGKTFRRNELQMKSYPQREAQSIHRETNVISNSTCTKQDDNLVEPNN